MKTLVVERDGRITVHEVNKPRYNEYQALVKTIACGMCGTDIKLIHRTFKGFPESVYPIMLGHEGVGEVVEAGSKVKGLKVGDKVLLPFVDPDPENLPGLGSGWGALSEYAVVCDPKAPWPGGAPDCAFAQTVLDDDLDPVDATMIVTFREVLSNIRYFGIQPQDSVVVFGCGPVGLTYLKFMSLLGVKDLVACDILPEKLEQARNYGATHLINSKECDVRAEVRKLFPGGVDYVLDAAGSPAIVNQGMGLIKDRGSVLCYGVPEKEEVTIDFSPADYNWRVIYQQMPRKREEGEAHAQVVEWMRSGELNIKDFISDYFTFDQAVEAYQKLLDRAFAERWVDVYENDGKQSGAFSCGVFGVHPYVLMNYAGTLNDAFTLAHELGHSMHSWFSDTTQDYVNHDYRIMVAEVASTVNEVLLTKYLLKTETDEKRRAYILNHFLESFRTTLYRQTLFAEFERKAHDLYAAGQPLTATSLNKVYHDLEATYYDGIGIDADIDPEWSYVPHFYRAFYVYQYATGFSSAVAIAEHILTTGDASGYLKFLTTGGSDYPLEELKIAGVDLTKPDTVRSALRVFDETIDELAKILL